MIETARLSLRRLSTDDAPFILQLLNDPAWLKHIGDRGVRTLEAAANYISNGPIASYAKHGFGLFLVLRKEDGAAIGLCGLLKRETLGDVDLGFAFLPEFRGQGYAFEAAAASLAFGRDVVGLARIVAIVSPGNFSSIRLLERLGLREEGAVLLSPETTPVKLFGLNLRPDASR